MEYLLEPASAGKIISRIEQLSPDTHPLWGKMNVSQMLAHCQAPMEIALGDRKLKWSFVGMLFGRIAKKKLLQDKPIAKNLPTDKSFIIKNPQNFEEEKRKLIHLLERFSNGGAEGLTKDPHPFFGKMTTEEWSALSWKHLDHHLKQFGV